MAHKGACLCGGVEFEIDGDLGMSGFCHCTRCRRTSGGGYQTGVLVEEGNFHITQGEELISSYAEEGFSTRNFCSRCGSAIYGSGGMTFVNAGLLADQSVFHPQMHVMVDFKAHWDQIGDDLPQFGEMPPMP